MNWRRGAFRIWLLAAVLWASAAYYLQLQNVVLAPSQQPADVHIKISNTETWHYPSAWGVEGIRADVARRLHAEDEADRVWAEQLPETRKAECEALPRDLPFDKMDKDCVRLIFSGDTRVVPTGWESQVERAPPCRNGNAVCEPWERDWDGISLSPGTVVTTQGGFTSPPPSLWESILAATPWALLPPLIALALGAGMLWALAGFGPKASKPD